MRHLALAILTLTGTAAAAPLEVATGGSCASGPPSASELLPASAVAGSVKILASPRGYDVFWTGQKAVGDPQFLGMYMRVAASGQRVGKPVELIDQPIRSVAAGADGVFALTYEVSTDGVWQAHVAAVRPEQRRVLWDVAVPSSERGHGTIAIAWDGKAWVVVGEESVQVPGSPAGVVSDRLLVGRIDRGGTWLVTPRYIEDAAYSASLSDWGNPLVAAGGKAAFVWVAFGSQIRTVYVTELDGDRVTHTPVASSATGEYRRVAIAAVAGGYAIAGGESGAGPMSSRVFVTTLRDGRAAPPEYLASERDHTSEPVVASDGTRIAVAWNQDELAASSNHGTLVHAAVIDARGTATRAYDTKPPPGRHDWTNSIAWDGCRFALVHLVGINPSAVELVRF